MVTEIFHEERQVFRVIGVQVLTEDSVYRRHHVIQLHPLRFLLAKISSHCGRSGLVDDTRDHCAVEEIAELEFERTCVLALDSVEHPVCTEELFARAFRDLPGCVAVVKRHIRQVNLEDVDGAVDVRTVDFDLAINTTVTDYCRIQRVRAIRCENHQSAGLIESVHLGKEHRNDGPSMSELMPEPRLPRTASASSRKMTAGETVLLVVLSRLLKEPANRGLGFPDILVENLGTFDVQITRVAVLRAVDLLQRCGGCLGEQSFAAARRAVQQNTLRGFLAVKAVEIRPLMGQFHSFDELTLRFDETADALPGDIRLAGKGETFVFLTQVANDDDGSCVQNDPVALFHLVSVLAVEKRRAQNLDS